MDEILKDFVIEAEPKLSSLQDFSKECAARFRECALFLGESDKSVDKTKPDSFFRTIWSFGQEMEKVRKNLQDKIDREEKKKEAQLKREAVEMAKKTSGGIKRSKVDDKKSVSKLGGARAKVGGTGVKAPTLKEVVETDKVLAAREGDMIQPSPELFPEAPVMDAVEVDVFDLW